MSRGLGAVLLMMFGGHGSVPQQNLREQPEPEALVEARPGMARKSPAIPLHPRLISPFAGKICRKNA